MNPKYKLLEQQKENEYRGLNLVQFCGSNDIPADFVFMFTDHRKIELDKEFLEPAEERVLKADDVVYYIPCQTKILAERVTNHILKKGYCNQNDLEL